MRTSNVVVCAGDRAARLANQSNPSRHNFSLIDDESDGVNHGDKVRVNLFPLYSFNFAERYATGELQAVLPLKSTLCSCEYNLVFRRIAQALHNLNGQVDGVTRLQVGQRNATPKSDMDDGAMFRSVSQFVYCPKQVTPSTVWFVRSKQRLNAIGQRFTSATVEATFEIS